MLYVETHAEGSRLDVETLLEVTIVITILQPENVFSYTNSIYYYSSGIAVKIHRSMKLIWVHKGH